MPTVLVYICYFRNNYAYARTVRTRPSLPPRRPGNEARFNKTLEIKFDNKINKSLTSFLIQRLALDVKRGNVAAVLGTIPATRDWAEVGLFLPTHSNG